MYWSTLLFGKYKGKTLPQVMFKDPDWFYWMYKNNKFEDKGVIATEAKDILRKSVAIRVPDINGKKYLVQHAVHKPDGSFAYLKLISEEAYNKMVLFKPDYVFETINMAFPSMFKNYDKLGCKLLLRDTKRILFGGKIKMTQKRCEEFFSDDSNFVL